MKTKLRAVMVDESGEKPRFYFTMKVESENEQEVKETFEKVKALLEKSIG
jgi:hypothetical protein